MTNNNISNVPSHIEDIRGRTIGCWLVESFSRVERSKSYWNCRCVVCGYRKELRRNTMTVMRNNTNCQKCAQLHKKGKRSHPLKNTYLGMMQRCYNPDHIGYEDYGGRSITVCQEWRDDFWQFVKDMGERPQGTTLGRKDNDLGYYPDNCRWETRIEQANNTRLNKWLTHPDGRRLRICDWLNDPEVISLGITRTLVHKRTYAGWSDADILTIRNRQAT